MKLFILGLTLLASTISVASAGDFELSCFHPVTGKKVYGPEIIYTITANSNTNRHIYKTYDNYSAGNEDASILGNALCIKIKK